MRLQHIIPNKGETHVRNRTKEMPGFNIKNKERNKEENGISVFLNGVHKAETNEKTGVFKHVNPLQHFGVTISQIRRAKGISFVTVAQRRINIDLETLLTIEAGLVSFFDLLKKMPDLGELLYEEPEDLCQHLFDHFSP